MPALSLDVIQKVIQQSEVQQSALQKAYALIPQTRCRRKTLCCSMMPEMTLIEALAVFQKMIDMTAGLRRRFANQIACYFFLNAVQITTCPFLDGQDCAIYEDRFLGCRTYGLWSAKYYRKLADRNRLAKKQYLNQWKHLGINLPRAVIDFQVPYCLDVATIDGKKADDDLLRKVCDKVESLSGEFAAAHQEFQYSYFSDFSFLLCALMFGFTEAVQLKYAIVKEILDTGKRMKLNRIISESPDIFTEMAVLAVGHKGEKYE
ncbi:MAG: hypothetical protein PVG87_07035 [Desulfobacteraceae bacterium]|jgi:Fe-S-cluster containining protein